MNKSADYSYYRREIAPVLPARVLDFPAPTWSAGHSKDLSS